jgi:Ca2+-binding RTX toxin-like protein
MLKQRRSRERQPALLAASIALTLCGLALTPGLAYGGSTDVNSYGSFLIVREYVPSQNQITISKQSDGVYRVTDVGNDITTYYGCTPVAAGQVDCAVNESYRPLVYVRLRYESDSVTLNTPANVRGRVYTDDGDDTVLGGDGEDRLSGRRGNDVLDGRAGDDRISGSFGDDILTGGLGEDRIHASAGNDDVRTQDGEVDRVSCGSGTDVFSVDAIDRVSLTCSF